MLPAFKRHPRRGPHDGLLWSGWLRLGPDRRIEVNVHVWFGLTLVGVTWLLAHGVLPGLFPGWHPATYWLVGASVAMTDGLAGLLHELGHAGMAVLRGRRVAHITLYGLAAGARRSGGPTRARDQVLIAVAGPACHLLIGGALWAAWTLLPQDNQPLRVAAGLPAVGNLAMGVLNLLPVAPIDGGRAARALITGLFRV